MKAVSPETVRLIADLVTPASASEESEVKRLERLATLPGFMLDAVPRVFGDSSPQIDDCHGTTRARLAVLLPSAPASETNYTIPQGRQKVLHDLANRAPAVVRRTLEPAPEVQAFEPSTADRKMALEERVMGSFPGVVECLAHPLLALTAAVATSFVLWLLI